MVGIILKAHLRAEKQSSSVYIPPTLHSATIPHAAQPHLQGEVQSAPSLHLTIHLFYLSAHFCPQLFFLSHHQSQNNSHPSLCPQTLWREIYNLSCVPLFCFQLSSPLILPFHSFIHLTTEILPGFFQSYSDGNASS